MAASSFNIDWIAIQFTKPEKQLAQKSNQNSEINVANIAGRFVYCRLQCGNDRFFYQLKFNKFIDIKKINSEWITKKLLLIPKKADIKILS